VVTPSGAGPELSVLSTRLDKGHTQTGRRMANRQAGSLDEGQDLVGF